MLTQIVSLFAGGAPCLVHRISISVVRASISVVRASFSVVRASISVVGGPLIVVRASLSIVRAALLVGSASLSIVRGPVLVGSASLPVVGAPLPIVREPFLVVKASLVADRVSLPLGRRAFHDEREWRSEACRTALRSAGKRSDVNRALPIYLIAKDADFSDGRGRIFRACRVPPSELTTRLRHSPRQGTVPDLGRP